MKARSLALACALLGATALASPSIAQTSPQGGAAQAPAEASPSTSSPDANARTGTSAQRDWRDQDGRIGGWRSSRDDDDERYGSRSQRSRYADDDDDDDHDDDMQGSRDSGRYGSGGRTGGQGMSGAGGMGQAMHRMSPEMMRMHARMMSRGGARLSLKRGDSQINIRCPASENISACVEAVGKLMDRLQAMPQTPR